jgi:hypothetical protein
MERSRIRKTITILLMFLLVSLTSCKHDYNTPKEYFFKNIVDKTTYISDSIYLAKVVKFMAINSVDPFRGPTFYDESTTVIIDTILYDKKNNLLAFWVITEISTSKLNDSDIDSPYFYNGICMYASRKNKKDILKVYEFGPVGFIMFPNFEDVHNGLSDYSFKYNKTFKRLDAKEVYNMDDIRFWSGIEWSEILKNPYRYKVDTVIKRKPTHKYINGEWVKL